MASEWKECTLAELGEIVGGATPSTKDESNYGGDIAWITPKDLSTLKGRFIAYGERNITEKGLNSCSTQMMPANTVLFSSRAPIGYVAIAANSVCTNQGFKSLVVNMDNDPMFMYYLLKYNKDAIEAMGSGTTFKEVSGSTMRSIRVSVPVNKSEQQKIASVLSALDSKIENNDKINDNLLRQAQLLFQSWFVDYQPFGGQMPNDWTEGVFADIVDFSNGYAFKSKELIDTPQPDCYRVFKQGHIFRGGGFNPDGTKSWYPRCKAEGLKKYVLKKGDILMAMTDMKDNVQILGNTAIMEVDDQYIVNQRVGVLRCKKDFGISYPYIFLLTNSKDFLLDLRSRANSGVQVNLSSTEIKNSPVHIAPCHVYEEFTAIVLPMFETMISNDIQNQQLAELRDTLLPKLMTGELDVSAIQI